jgi:hypothetical protein
MTIQELLNTIFEDQSPPWTEQFETWVRSSRRFRTFAETHVSKIGKKLRNVRDEAGFIDLYYELETAYRLLQAQHFSVEYEKYNSLKQRGPDFTVSFRVNLIFNMEVTRLRAPEEPPDSFSTEAVENLTARKITEMIFDKVGQMIPNSINIIRLASDFEISPDKLTTVLTQLRLAAEQKQNEIFSQRGFGDARDFIRQWQHLSSIFCEYTRGETAFAWHNSIAKNPTPKALANALQKI